MSAHAIDSPLQLLKKESTATLSRIQQAAESYLQDPTDTAPLEQACVAIDEMRGVFTMLGQAEAATLMQETGTLAASLIHGEIAELEPAREALSHAVLQAPRYFEWLQRQGQKPSFDLAPLTLYVRAARGAPPSANAERAHQPSELAARLRPRLQQALIGVLRGQSDKLLPIASICDRFKKAATNESHYRLWWLAEGLLREVLDQRITLDQPIRLMLRDLEHHLKRLIDESEPPADDATMRDLSARIIERLSHSEQGRTRLSQANGYQPPYVGAARQAPVVAPYLIDSVTLQTTADLAREALMLIQDALDRFGHDRSRLEKLRDELPRLRTVASVLQILNMALPASLTRRHIETFERWLAEPGATADKDVDILQIAGEILLVQSSLTNVQDFYAQNLIEPGTASVDVVQQRELLRLFYQRQAQRIVVAEARNLVQSMRELLASSPPDWNALDTTAHLIGGSLTVLRRTAANPLISSFRALFQALAAGAAPADPETLATGLAEAVIALEHYIATSDQTQTLDTPALAPAQGKLQALGAALGVSTPPAQTEHRDLPPAVIDDPTIALDDITESVPAPEKPAPTAPPLLDDLSLDLERALRSVADTMPTADSLPTEFDMLEPIDLPVPAATSPSRPITPEVDIDSAPPMLLDADDFDLTLQNFDIEPPAPVATRATPEPPPASAKQRDVDPELFAVFFEEARDELEAIGGHLAAWRANFTDQDALISIRRSFHTLKGSGRMVGQTLIGEFGWHFEQLLNRVLEGQLAPSPAIADAIGQAQALLEPVVAQCSTDGHEDALVNLALRAEALAQGEEAAVLEEDIAAAAPADAHTPVFEEPVLADTEEPAPFEEPPASTAKTPAEPIAQPSSSATPAVAEPDRELLEVFQTEATEILDTAEFTLQRWSANLDNHDLLNDLRRDMHTLKGGARLTGLAAMGNLAHAIESILDAVGKGELPALATPMDLLQRALDGLSFMLAQTKEGIALSPAEDLLNELHGVLGVSAADSTQTASTAEAASTTPALAAASPVPKPALFGADSIRVDAGLLNNLINQMGESSIFRSRVDQGVGAVRFNLSEMDQTVTRLRQQLRRLEIETEAQILFRREGPKDHKTDFDPLELDRFSELQQLSRSLMEIVDDLSNVQNSLEDQTQEMDFLLDQQAKVNKEIQQGLMQTRMVRFSSVAPRLRRVVRQAAQELGKRAQLVIEGSESDVDRTVLDRMTAPLEHMLRNAVAHGIEAPEARRTAGKPEIGTISVGLRREGAELVIELSDDGNGLNFDAIRAKGIANGMLKRGQSASEQDLIALLLRPGFSTADQVTQIAGRGVGLDVLNDTVKALRGALQIQSQRSRGTTFIVRLPFSLAITQALLVQAGGDTYAVPLLSIQAVNRLAEGELHAYLAGEEVRHRYTDYAFPLHSLRIALGYDAIPYDSATDTRPIALLFRSAEGSAALQVDAVLGNQEIIVKPVAPQLHGVPGISGATVLGDGRVVVVLDLAALVRNLASQAQKNIEADMLRNARQEPLEQPRRITAMIVDDSITMRKVTSRFLARHNIDAVLAKDGIEAVALLEQEGPDFVILDIEMPRMDGFEVLAHIRNQSHLQHLPVVMVTSRSGEKHRERAAKLGVNDYLIKPYQEEEMLASIRKLLPEERLELMM